MQDNIFNRKRLQFSIEKGKKMTKLWWEDQPHKMYVFTEEDIMVVLKLLDKVRNRDKNDEFERVINRILIQRLP
jgi:sugar diacid utilization regulator